VRGLVDERHADVIVSTAHKAKGREWATVRIANDFPEPEAGRRRRDPLVPPEDAMLAYVAVTRARKLLDPEGLSWIDKLVPAGSEYRPDPLARAEACAAVAPDYVRPVYPYRRPRPGGRARPRRSGMSAVQTPGRGESSVVMDSQQPRPGTDMCRHDLLAASCIWCTPRPGIEDLDVDLDDPRELVRGPKLGAWRVATDHGKCTRCAVPILPGDLVRPKGRARFCEECGGDEDA
jgi:hypothetical protein